MKIDKRTGVQRIADERVRQLKIRFAATHDNEELRFTRKHDDREYNALAWAAACYAAPECIYRERRLGPDDGAVEISFADPFPWRETTSDCRGRSRPLYHTADTQERIRQLEKAGALCAAEIDRLLRASGRSKSR